MDILSVFADKLGWEFILPGAVWDELNAQSVPMQIKKLLYGKVKIESCTGAELRFIQKMLPGLGAGESDAICIVNKCPDRKFGNYLILTDDVLAQNRAGSLGMNTLDVLMFLFLSNRKGIISKEKALNLVNRLEECGYEIERTVRRDYERRLV